MLGGAQAAAAVCAETRDETDKVNQHLQSKEFDRWSDDDTQVKATSKAKERDFDTWSEDSVEVVELEQKEDQELFFTDAAPDHSLLGVSSKHSAPHPSAPQPAEVEVRLSPRPPKAPPPAHLLQRQAVEWLRKKAEVPVQPPQPPAPAMPAMPATVPRGRPVPPPPRLIRPGSVQSAPVVQPMVHPVVQPMVRPVQHVQPQMAGQQVPQTMPQVPRGVRQVAVTPVVLVPVSPCATWSCFLSLQHGLERMKLFATLLLGDATTAQALVRDANANLKLSHRTSFEDVKKAALKAVLQLVPMTDVKDQQARDSLEKYLLSKDRAGVVRVGLRDLYLIPPSKAEDCGLKVVPQAKCIVAAVAEKSRSTKKSKNTPEVKKKAAEVVVADDTEDSEEPKNNDKKVDNNGDQKEDQRDEKKVGEAAVEEKNEEATKEETNEDLEAAAPEGKKEEAKPEAKQEAKQNKDSKVPHSPFESLKAQAKPQAKPRFSRLDVENAAFEIARSRDDRQAHPEPALNPRGPVHHPRPGHGPGPWPAFPPEPWWNPYVSPHTDHGAQPERRRKRHRSSKERRRTRRRSKESKTKAGSDDSDTSASQSPRPSEPVASFRNPYIDPVPIEEPAAETEENHSAEPVDEKWKGLLARVEALAEFCRADSVEDG